MDIQVSTIKAERNGVGFQEILKEYEIMKYRCGMQLKFGSGNSKNDTLYITCDIVLRVRLKIFFGLYVPLSRDVKCIHKKYSIIKHELGFHIYRVIQCEWRLRRLWQTGRRIVLPKNKYYLDIPNRISYIFYYFPIHRCFMNILSSYIPILIFNSFSEINDFFLNF